MKTKQPEVVSALRTTLAAIDNAEAVAPADGVGPAGSEHVAGAQHGVGSTEATRRALTTVDLEAIVAAQVADRLAEADRYDRLGRPDAADRLRGEADALQIYLPPDPAVTADQDRP
ncbi:hypothetical protein [Sporichthya polymorpha]|uniref:hypothetical protein n=1 Tax=Sporichthya polymorpha TaxID=35751 RepID=UPI00316ADDC8